MILNIVWFVLYNYICFHRLTVLTFEPYKLGITVPMTYMLYNCECYEYNYRLHKYVSLNYKVYENVLYYIETMFVG